MNTKTFANVFAQDQISRRCVSEHIQLLQGKSFLKNYENHIFSRVEII